MPHIPNDNLFSLPECDFWISTLSEYECQQIGTDPDLYLYKLRQIGPASGGLTVYGTNTEGHYLFAGPERLVLEIYRYKYNRATQRYDEMPKDSMTLSSAFTYNDLTVYFTYGTSFYVEGGYRPILYTSPVSTGDITDSGKRGQYAWLMVYGEYTDGFSVTYTLDNCTGDSGNPGVIAPSAVVTNMDFTPDEGYKFLPTSITIVGDAIGGGPVQYVWDHETGHLRVGAISSDIIIIVKATSEKDPYEEGGDSTAPGGGEGDFDNTTEPVPTPDLPTLNVANTGFISLFNPSISQLNALATYLWSDAGLNLDTFKRIFSDPISTILGLTIVPVPPVISGASNVKLGNVDTGVSMPRISTQYVRYDCGTLNVNEYWGGYLDYSPYTSAEIYLPYIGTKPINIDDIMGKSVNVSYNIDLLSGACCAFIKCDNSVLYQFIGQCACSVPVTGRDMTNLINGILSVVGAGAGTFVATGGVGLSMASAIGSLASNVTKSKPRVEKSGSMGSMGGMLGIKSPYLVLTRPKQALPAAQNRYTGYPSYITSMIGELSGYTEMASVHLGDMPATSEEKDEIERLLLSGVIL